MQDRLFVVAMVLLVGALLFFGTNLVYGPAVTTTTVRTGNDVKPPSSYAELTPHALTSQTLRINWSDAQRGTHVYLATAAPDCYQPAGVVGQANGTSGAFSSSVTPGLPYYLFACSALSNRSANLSYQFTGGFTWLDLAGLFCAIPAAVFFGLSFRAPRPRTEGPEGENRRRDDPHEVAAALGAAQRQKRYDLAQPGRRTKSRWGRSVQECPACGRIFTYGKYAACPVCGASFVAGALGPGPGDPF